MDELTLRWLEMISELRSLSIASVIMIGIGLVLVLYEIGINKLADLIYNKVMAKIEKAHSEKEMGEYIEHQFDRSMK
jgi:hypothetical protein